MVDVQLPYKVQRTQLPWGHPSSLTLLLLPSAMKTPEPREKGCDIDAPFRVSTAVSYSLHTDQLRVSVLTTKEKLLWWGLSCGSSRKSEVILGLCLSSRIVVGRIPSRAYDLSSHRLLVKVTMSVWVLSHRTGPKSSLKWLVTLITFMPLCPMGCNLYIQSLL